MWVCACQWSWAEKDCDQALGGMLIGLARIVLLDIPIIKLLQARWSGLTFQPV